MKKLLVLAGGSKRNQVWGEECFEHFEDQFDEVFFIQYDHWATEEKNINFETELEKIKSIVARESVGEGNEWFIFAKSIGTILALKAVIGSIIKPTKCVFFGMPLSIVAEDLSKDDWLLLKGFAAPTLAFHNDNDPTALYDVAKEKVAMYAPSIQLETLQGDNHDYLDFASYENKINLFLKN